MLQCTSKADMEDWVRDTNRLRGGRVDLASGQNIGGYPSGHDIYEGWRNDRERERESLIFFLATGVPDDEIFRVVLRPTNGHSFSGSCYLEIQR